MRRFRLNGWQRVGIILSILWIPVGGVWALKAFGPPENIPEPPFFNLCLEQEAKQPTPNAARCNDAAQKWYASLFKLRNLQHANAERLALWYAFLPIPIAWLLVYCVSWMVRWVRRGFQPST